MSCSRASGSTKTHDCVHYVLENQTFCAVVPPGIKRALSTIPLGHSASVYTEIRRWCTGKVATRPCLDAPQPERSIRTIDDDGAGYANTTVVSASGGWTLCFPRIDEPLPEPWKVQYYRAKVHFKALGAAGAALARSSSSVTRRTSSTIQPAAPTSTAAASHPSTSASAVPAAASSTANQQGNAPARDSAQAVQQQEKPQQPQENPQQPQEKEQQQQQDSSATPAAAASNPASTSAASESDELPDPLPHHLRGSQRAHAAAAYSPAPVRASEQQRSTGSAPSTPTRRSKSSAGMTSPPSAGTAATSGLNDAQESPPPHRQALQLQQQPRASTREPRSPSPSPSAPPAVPSPPYAPPSSPPRRSLSARVRMGTRQDSRGGAGPLARPFAAQAGPSGSRSKRVRAASSGQSLVADLSGKRSRREATQDYDQESAMATCGSAASPSSSAPPPPPSPQWSAVLYESDSSDNEAPLVVDRLPPFPPPGPTAGSQVSLEWKLWHERRAFKEALAALRAIRTPARVKQVRLDKGLVLPQLATMAQVWEAMKARLATMDADVSGAELKPFIIIVKRVMGERSERQLESAIDLKNWFRGVDTDKLVMFVLLLMKSWGILFCRNVAQLEAQVKARPELDASMCHERGIYGIAYKFTGRKGREEEALYIGGAFEQDIAARIAQHLANFRAMDKAVRENDTETIHRLQLFQRDLYKAGAYGFVFFVVSTTSAPRGSAMAAAGVSDAVYLRALFWYCFKEDIDRYGPRILTNAHVVKMVNALNEHFFVSTFNTLNGDYPLVCLLFGASWPHRRFKQVNAVVPAVQFVDRSKKAEKGKGRANQTGDKAAPPPAKQRVVTAHALINEPLPVVYAPGPCASTREALKIVEECHLRLDSPMASPSSSSAAADSDLVIEDIPFDIAAFKEPTSQRTFEAAIDYARYQKDEDQDTIDFAEDPVTGGISASSASSPSRRGAQRPREPRTTLIAPLLPDVARKAIRQRICFAGGEGFPFKVADGRIELQTGFVKVGTISLGQEHLSPPGPIPDGTNGTFYVEHRDPDRPVYAQPAAAPPGASWTAENRELVFEWGKGQRKVWRPFRAIVDRGWEAVGKLVSEVVTFDMDSHGGGRLVHQASQLGRYADVYNGIGVRLKEGGSRWPLVAGPEFYELELPKGSAFLMGLSDNEEDDMVVQVRGIPLKPYHDLVLFANKSDKRGQYDSLRYALRPRSDGEPVGATHRLGDAVDQSVTDFFLRCISGVRAEVDVEAMQEYQAAMGRAE